MKTNNYMQNNWNVDSLKEYFEAILVEKDKAINIALIASEKASLKTEQAQRDYNSTHNDIQRKMDAQYKDMIPRAEFNAYKESQDKALKVEKERGDIGQGKGQGLTQGWGYLIGIIGLALAVFSYFK